MNPNLRRPVAARPGKASRRAPTLPHANVGFTAPPVQNVRYVTTPQTPFDASYYNASDDNSWHNHSMQNYTSPSPMTVSSVSPRGWSPTPMEQRSGGAASPYGFVPIGTTATAMTAPSISHGRFTPPTSPYGATGCWKPTRHGTVSPSMMSILTEDTVDTASLTVDTNSFRFTPVSARPSPRPWERPATPSSTTSTATTATGRKSPYAKKQTAQDDDSSTRKIRIKTEMCMHYSSGKVCPFGADCTYAHGEEELQMTRLLDMHKAGLVDKDTYRTKPCLTWVATGSCPFGKRCSGIHDPRVGGPHSSWLPQTETQGNTMTTDINVEALHQKRQHEILYNHPFGNNFDLQADSWSDLYKLVCNVDYSSNNKGRIDKRRKALKPMVKLEMALAMRGTDSSWHFKYRPQHIINGTQCMVLQKRAFALLWNNEKKVREIPVSSYNPRNNTHVMVREIAFGPDADPSVREVALWFNIPEEEVAECTPQQAKRFRWKRPVKTAKESSNSSKKKKGGGKAKAMSLFDTLESFEMIRPHDKDAFVLVTDLMKHRLSVLQAELLAKIRVRYEKLKQLEQVKTELKDRFESQKRHWNQWAWPICKGRDRVTAKTPVPKVDGEYDISSLSHAQSMWDNFTHADYCQPCEVLQEREKTHEETLAHSVINSLNIDKLLAPKRLPIFDSLASGFPLSGDRTLPHIRKVAFPEVAGGKTGQVCRSQERCWKALLLPDQQNTGNEWDLVREHFLKSRSNKVLSIIQKK